MAQFQTYYDNLQVTRNASDVVIRSAYRSLCQKYHPDKNTDDSDLAHRRIKLINEAYAALADPVRRAEHDAWIKRKEDQAREEEERAANSGSAHQRDDFPMKNTTFGGQKGASDSVFGQSHQRDINDDWVKNIHFPETNSATFIAVTKIGTKVKTAIKKTIKFTAYILLVVASFVAFKIFKDIAHDNYQSNSTNSIVPAPVVSQSESELYDIAVREVMVNYPQLNPNLPGYRSDLSDELTRIMITYKAQGLAEQDALRRAVADMEAVPVNASPPERAVSGDQKRAAKAKQVADRWGRSDGCVYKGVMTDEDYRRCDVRAPQTR